MCNCNIVMCVNTGKAGSARVAVAVGAVTLTAVEVHKGLWAQRGHAAPAPGGQRVPRGQGIGSTPPWGRGLKSSLKRRNGGQGPCKSWSGMAMPSLDDSASPG